MGRPLNSLNRKGRNDRKGKASDLKRKAIFGFDKFTKKQAMEFERVVGIKYTTYRKTYGFEQAKMQANKLFNPSGIKAQVAKGKGKVLGKDVNKKSDGSRRRKY